VHLSSMSRTCDDGNRIQQTSGLTASATMSAQPVRRTRLWLNDATGQVLRNGLELLGVGAPDRM